MLRSNLTTFLAAAVLAIGQIALAQSSDPCQRFPAGSAISEPEDLFSHNGMLTVNLSYQTGVDPNGNTVFCFINQDGAESPTLHVDPGDTLVLNVTNKVPTDAPGLPMMHMHHHEAAPALEVTGASSGTTLVCGATTQTPSSMNIHYHGTNTSPTCHSDEVIHTLINSGDSFTYTIHFPADEPPGLYWYHPHVHGIAEAAVQGGASGAIVVEGIQNVQPLVAGLPQRLLLVRDNPVPPSVTTPNPPAWDISLNYIPIPFPDYPPAVIPMRPLERQLWRVGNLCADTILDLQLQFDGQPVPVGIVALDGVPTGSQDGTRRGRIVPATHVLIPPAGRAEFVVQGPAATVRNATLVTLGVQTGIDGDNDPQRPIATIRTGTTSARRLLRVPQVTGPPNKQRFEGLAAATPTAERLLYFSENADQTEFFITVDGQTPTVFDPTNPPAITTTQGSVEDWTIQNRALENHEFHMHQIHFLVLSQDNFEVNGFQPVDAIKGQFLDMIQIPAWDGDASHPFPSVRLRMDFRGPDIGDFVYHCHILNHEDQGMMAIIRVVPPGSAAKTATPAPVARQAGEPRSDPGAARDPARTRTDLGAGVETQPGTIGAAPAPPVSRPEQTNR